MIHGKSFHVLYLAAQLPKQSETFVYREVLGLRERGVNVSIASVHAPQTSFGDGRVDALAAEVIPIYPPGKWAMFKDAVRSLAQPRGWRTLLCGLRDAMVQRDVPLRKRPTIVWQCLAGLALARRAQAKRIDHLHAHMAHVPTTIGMYAAMALGVPFSFTGHAADLFRDRSLLAVKLRRAARAMCISRWHRRFYQGITAIAEDRLPVVRCGVDVQTWRSTATPATSTTDILAVGRLVPKKGFDILIRSVAHLQRENVPTKCTIVGDGPELEALQRLLLELGMEKHVRMVGSQSNENVRSLMQEHGVFALPCRTDSQQDRDGIPVVLMEAMACGAAVVSGDLPTIRELIQHEVNGLLVPPDDVVALAGALRSLVSDPHKRSSLGSAARRTVCGEFALDLNLERLEAALRGLPERAIAANSTHENGDARLHLLSDQPLPR